MKSVMDYQQIFPDQDFFRISVQEYDCTKDFMVTRPASLNHPRNNAVMFVQDKYIAEYRKLLEINSCLIFWPDNHEVPARIAEHNAISLVADPHLAFCSFFRDHNISNFADLGVPVNHGHYITVGKVTIGNGTKIFPYVYINGHVHIGKNCYLGAGVKVIGNVYMGDNVVVKENTVLGADGLSTDRDETGRAVTMPQFGGLIIEDDVQIGACTVIARGAIDNTVIRRGCKIDNACFISHNNYLDENVFMVGESTTFGSVSVGKNAQLSGNATVRNGLHIGEGSLVGAASLVTRNVASNTIVSGNPARPMLFPSTK